MIGFLKKNWLYILIILGLAVLSILDVSTFRYGFFTAYDEAYFLLKMQEAYDMSCITGKSQWNLIAVQWFPYMDMTSKVNSYLAGRIIVWFTILAMTATCCFLFDKKKVLRYFALIYLVYFSVCRNAMSYIPLQITILCWALCAFMLFHHSGKPWLKYLFAVVCGLCLGLACFVYIPAALLVLGCVALLIIVLYWGDKKTMLLSLVSGIGGVGLAVGYMHFCVCNVGDIIEAMQFTAGYIGKSGYKYNGSSFVMQYGMFVRDLVFVVIAFTGSYYLSKVIRNKYVGTVLYVLLLLVYVHYQKDPGVTPFMFLVSLPVLPVLMREDGGRRFAFCRLFRPNLWLNLFLLAFPLLASFGTNTDLGGRISGFTISWLFLFFHWEARHGQSEWNRVLVGAMVLMLLPLGEVIDAYRNRDDSFHFTRGNKYFAELAITEKQKDYFDNVYDILEDYNYKPKESVVFTALYDYCCLYAFDAVNSSNFHQVQNFHFFDKEKMLKPDFIFMCKWDSVVLTDELHEMPWGWPEDFDRYEIGTPEPDDAPWVISSDLEKRTLYCRKSLKTGSDIIR